jgi:cathepsin L
LPRHATPIAPRTATGKLLELAPQMYVSCSPNPNECGGTGGCEGSTQWLAFNYSLTAGLAAETTYPCVLERRSK